MAHLDLDGRVILKRSLKRLYWANSDRVLQGPIVITEMHIGGFIKGEEFVNELNGSRLSRSVFCERTKRQS